MHLVTIVSEDYVYEVLADVVDIALHGGEYDLAPASFVGPGHMGFQVCNCSLHDLGRLKYERQLHAARAEKLTDGLHPGHQRPVDYVQRWQTVAESLIQFAFETFTGTVDHTVLEATLDRPTARVLFCQRFRAGPFEKTK